MGQKVSAPHPTNQKLTPSYFASLALAAAMLISGLMARQISGQRGAQLLTVFAVVPAAIGAGMLMQYVDRRVHRLRHGSQVHHRLPRSGCSRRYALHRCSAL